ncbi:unnamed protein product [Litomosoides sigmodontis]|uniref:Nucleolar protein 16 n=1 Tax=Litomosoides sigmodontis TaxID=42156 RepID=A0A3P6T2S5_LITSI|nr:unnamed protein product [Litomosoides sigmodontis]
MRWSTIRFMGYFAKLKNVSGNGSPKKASATKSTKTKNSTIEGTTKPKQVQRAVNVAKQEITAKKVNEPKVTKVSKSENGSKSKHQYVKDEKLVLTKEKRSQLPSPAKLEQKTEKIEQKKLVQSKETANENEQVHANTGKAKGISKGQTKEKRRQQSDPDSLLPERDFVEGNAHEMASKKAKDDFTERVRLQQKKKGRYRDEQQSKSVESAEEFTDKTTVYDGKNQSCTLESIGFKTGEMVDQVTPSSNEIPKDSEILLKTEMIRKAPVPEELGTNAARLAEKHLEPLGITGLRGGNVIKNMTMKTPANEAKDEANVEKKEPFIVVPQTDGVSRVTPTRERICKLLPRDIQFCVHMIEKHGDDYEAMAKDQSNTFRDSAKGIARKIRIFKESPQYETYLKQKSEKNDPVA